MKRFWIGLVIQVGFALCWAGSALAAPQSPSPSVSQAPIKQSVANDDPLSWLWITAITVALAVGYAAWRRYEKKKRQK